MENDYLYSKLQLILEVLAKLYASNTYVKGSEISEILGINDRGVRRIIEELRDLGYNIVAKPGIYGGYRLLKDNLFLPLIIDEKYQTAWQELLSYIISSKDLANYSTIISLLNSLSLLSERPPLDYYESYQGFQLNPIIRNRIDDAYQILETAIKNHQVVNIVYEKINPLEISEFEFIPYRIIVYNQNYYIKGHYYKDTKLITLKLSRIKEINLSNKLFVFDEDFSFKEKTVPFSEEVFSKIKVVLRISNKQIDLKDYIFGDNQVIQDNENHFILTCEMYGDLVVRNFVLSLGVDCEVIEPLWLKKELKEIGNQLYLKY